MDKPQGTDMIVFWRRAAATALVALSVTACGSLGGVGAPSWWPFGVHPDQADATTALAVYDIGGMLAQVAPVINDALAMNLPSDVEPAAREHLHAAVRKAFDPTVLSNNAARRLLARARADERGAALVQAAVKLDSPLPRRMVANEQAAATEKFAQGFAEFLEQPVDPAGEPRMQKMRKLNDALELVALQIAFNVGMMRGMVAARNAVSSPTMETSQATLQRMLDQTRQSLRPRLQQHLPVMLFYAHRKVSEEDLDTYLEMQTGPALRWLNAALPDVLQETLAAAAKRLREQYRPLPGLKKE
ncbi:MAG: hypothetical protein L0H83_02745 [Salinisphaera sp.]|nr:hypothetical protein [Salinisphaera sp.]